MDSVPELIHFYLTSGLASKRPLPEPAMQIPVGV